MSEVATGDVAESAEGEEGTSPSNYSVSNQSTKIALAARSSYPLSNRMQKHKCLKELRQAAQFTQKQLAELAGIPWRTLVNIETGQRRLSDENAMAISAVTGVEASSLLKPRGKPRDFAGKPFTRESFLSHRGKYVQLTPERTWWKLAREAAKTQTKEQYVSSTAERRLLSISEAPEVEAEERELFAEAAAADIGEAVSALQGLLAQAFRARRLESALVAFGYWLRKAQLDFALEQAAKKHEPVRLPPLPASAPDSALSAIVARFSPSKSSNR